ncbi:ABC transporter substrate-binding protein [Micromonospora inositola]|nr:extracellular solute-binding protein [Micromonospora inositola]
MRGYTRRLAAAGMAASLFMLTTACGSDDGDKAAGNLSGDLRVLAFDGTSNWKAQLEAAAKDYEAKHAGVDIKIEMAPYDGYKDALETRLVSRTAADLVLVEPPMVQGLGGRGLATDLTGALGKANSYGGTGTWRDGFRPGSVESTMDSGKAVMVPWSAVWVGLAYNKKAYEKAGITTPPATWQDWIAANDKLKASGQAPLYTAIKNDDAQTWWLLTTMLQALYRPKSEQINLRHADGWKYDHAKAASVAGESYTPDELYVAFRKGVIDPAKSAEYRRAVELMLQLKPHLNPNALAAKGAEVEDKFVSGASVQDLTGTFAIPGILTKIGGLATDKQFEIGATNFPSITPTDFPGLTAGGTNPLAGTRNGWMIPAATKQSALAVDFLQFITSPDQASRMWATKGDSGTTAGDPAEIVGVQYPDSFTKVDTTAKFAEIPLYGFGMPPTFDTKDFDEFIAQWQSLWSGKASIDQFLSQRSKSNLDALERNLKVSAAQVDQGFIKRELG